MGGLLLLEIQMIDPYTFNFAQKLMEEHINLEERGKNCSAKYFRTVTYILWFAFT